MVLIQQYLDDVKTTTKSGIVNDFTYVDFGTGTTPVTVNDTTMETSVVRNARQEVLTLSDSVIVSGFLNTTQANASAISEIGIFDESSGGSMKQHALIDAINKTSSKEVWVDIRTNVTVTQS